MLDKIWRALGGRKFLAFVAATILCWFGKITGEIWLMAMGFFVGANVAQKFLLNRGAPNAGKAS